MEAAIRTLKAERVRAQDKVEAVLFDEDTPIEVVEEFMKWVESRMKDRYSSIDNLGLAVFVRSTSSGKSYLRLIAEYEDRFCEAKKQCESRNARLAVDMLSLLAIEQVGYGKRGRNERKAQVRQLLKMCREWNQKGAAQ